MKNFKLDKNYVVECIWQDEYNGFSHIAKLLKNNKEVNSIKVKYDNRTWETWEFKTAIKKVIDGYFNGKNHSKYINIVNSSLQGF